MSLSDDAYPPSLSGQKTSQGGLEREFMDIDDRQGYDDLPAIMMDESLLETGFEGDGYGGVIRDRLGHQLSKWPTKVPESLIPPYSCRQPSPYQDEPIFCIESTARNMPLLATVLAVFSIFLTAFAGLPQRLGDMVKAVIQVILELAIAEGQQALRRRVRGGSDSSGLSSPHGATARPPWRREYHRLLQFHHELRVRGYRFRPLDPTFKEEWIVDGATQLPRLNRKNACSFVECRPPLRRFGDFHQPTMTGILWTVFSHIRRASDGRILSHRLFGVFRWFKPSIAYGYRYDEEKTLDIQVFSQHQLSPPFFFPIHAKSLPSIHPVALVSVPQRSSAPLGTKIIVTVPVARHT
ncbi:hypothetical protein CNB05440 [Cryptococcus deneoformans JEC21]|uniref:Uncharacterized protein n=1 Tax=Cryptococcus deneoformans (strain JEC21 / ATCC MYA-565) TaxID=214684 RepID=Q5KLF6_CRYD1|nr:hypothetical protein CNB05440 [Cryptococcus neoformans var. neoformans JEC21]AAW41982.2 hypothetical protein CNB05440 [Cryptococcus neoformans var. neoformans JEC21]